VHSGGRLVNHSGGPPLCSYLHTINISLYLSSTPHILS
jgi:hypothetical protein